MSMFDSLAIELITDILYKVQKWQSIAAHVCVLWRDIIININKGKNLSISVRLILSNSNLIKWWYDSFKENKCSNKLIENSKIFEWTARYGTLESLQFLYKRGFTKCEYACSQAILANNFNMLKWLHENNFNFETKNCADASYYGNMEILIWLHEKGCPWDRGACEAAAYKNRLDILKYLYENRCPWDGDTSINAVWGGNLEILKYLYENGCPCDFYRLYCEAIELDRKHIMQYLMEHDIYGIIN